jgi:hypothetical protein
MTLNTIPSGHRATKGPIAPDQPTLDLELENWRSRSGVHVADLRMMSPWETRAALLMAQPVLAVAGGSPAVVENGMNVN